MQHAQNRWPFGRGAQRSATDFAPPLSAVHPARVTEATCRRTYDHRLRELAYHAGAPGVAQRLGVPRSTAKSWMRRGMPDVVTLDVFDSDASELLAQAVRLENRVRRLLAIVRLLFSVIRISGVRLDGDRVPHADDKTKLLGAIEHARTSLKLTVVLRLIGLSPSRHHAWTKRQKECALDDRYFGSGDPIAARLAQHRVEARQARLAANRILDCAQCRTDGLRPSAIFDVVHLHPHKSQIS